MSELLAAYPLQVSIQTILLAFVSQFFVMSIDSIPPIADLEKCLLCESDPIAKRLRSVFYLKQVGTEEAIDSLSRGLKLESVLLSHDVAYCLGQIGNSYANKYLIDALEDLNLDPIVRHEAGEALGAIGSAEALPVLDKFCEDAAPEVSETCKLAAGRIRYVLENPGEQEKAMKSKHHTIDPAPAVKEKKSIDELKAILIDENETLFNRYRAMFSLRDIGNEASVLVCTVSNALLHSSQAFCLCLFSFFCLLFGMVCIEPVSVIAVMEW